MVSPKREGSQATGSGEFRSFVLIRPLDRFDSDQADNISQRVLNLKIAVAQKSSGRSPTLPSPTLLGRLTFRISNPMLTTGPSSADHRGVRAIRRVRLPCHPSVRRISDRETVL